jgi:hypothetical protein
MSLFLSFLHDAFRNERRRCSDGIGVRAHSPVPKVAQDQVIHPLVVVEGSNKVDRLRIEKTDVDPNGNGPPPTRSGRRAGSVGARWSAAS